MKKATQEQTAAVKTKTSKVKTQDAPEPATITFNGKVYISNDLPQDIQEFVRIHQKWMSEIGAAREEVFKYEAAIRGLLSELETKFKDFDAIKA